MSQVTRSVKPFSFLFHIERAEPTVELLANDVSSKRFVCDLDPRFYVQCCKLHKKQVTWGRTFLFLLCREVKPIFKKFSLKDALVRKRYKTTFATEMAQS